MAEPRQADPVKLFVGILSAFPGALAEAEAALGELLGPIEQASAALAHDFTEYYRDEMGHPLIRRFVSFGEPIDPGRMPEIKLATNELERTIAESGRYEARRPVNLDPGYVTPAKLVLASCKDYTHRIYLSRGVYGETTLAWTASAWHAYEWTYPDFRTAEYHEFFRLLRERLRQQLREARHA